MERLDAALGLGLKADGLHEVHAPTPGDLASALGLALLLGQRASGQWPVVWIRSERRSRGAALPYGPGLAALGVEPAALILLALPEAKAALRAALDVARDGAAGTVLLELAGRQPLLDLTASRRLALAAADTGTLVLVVRSAAEPVASAAHTRWQVAAAASCPLEANAPGLPAFALTLLRQRGGRDGISMIVEWNRDTASFRERDEATSVSVPAAPLPRPVPAVAAGGADRADQRNAA
ncbi:MAG TPA: hypothetical protein VI199_11395 [Novosphingobium sp.]